LIAVIDLRKRELELVAAEYGELDHGPNIEWLVLCRWQLPSGWNQKETRLLIIIPSGYPVTPPDNFYTDADLRLADGRQPGNTSLASHQGENWLQFSYHLESGDWRPQANLLEGDNLLTFLIGVAARLAELD